MIPLSSALSRDRFLAAGRSRDAQEGGRCAGERDVGREPVYVLLYYVAVCTAHEAAVLSR